MNDDSEQSNSEDSEMADSPNTQVVVVDELSEQSDVDAENSTDDVVIVKKKQVRVMNYTHPCIDSLE